MAECKDCIHYDMCKYRPLAIGVDICDVFRNTADVVPKSEVEELEAECERQYEQAKADILANMADGGTSCHWCIDEHKAQAKAEVAREIFEEIEQEIKLALESNYKVKSDAKDDNDGLVSYVDGKIHCLRGLKDFITDSKKKYTQGGLTKSKMCDKMTIGECIRKCREEKKLTQDALAKKAGISPPAISHWENNRAYPTILLLICIADVLDVSLDQLVGRDFHKN